MTNTLQSWRNIKLGQACKITKGVTYKSEDYASDSDGQVFLTLKCIAKGGGFNYSGVKYYKGKIEDSQLVGKGNLIIANTDLSRAGDVIGAPLIVPQIRGNEKYVISMDISRLSTDETKLDKNYLYHFLTSPTARNYMKSISNGSTVLHLKVNLVNDLSIPLPPIATQNKIAEILGSVEIQIHHTGQIIQKAEALKRGLLEKIFENSDYDLRQLSDMCLEVVDCPHTTPKYFENGEYLVVRTPNVRNGKLEMKGALFTNEEVYIDRISRYSPQPGDVLLTREAPAGETCLVPVIPKLCLGQRMMCLRADEKKILPEYLAYLFYSPVVKRSFQKKSSGTTVFHFNVSEIKKLQIPVPTLDRQREIVDLLKSLDSKIDLESKQLNKSLLLKNGLMNDIFSKKVQIV